MNVAVYNWPKVYLQEIQLGHVAVSAEVRAVYEREVEWMDNPPSDPEFCYVFDAEKGLHHIQFMEKYCKHSKGAFGGKPIRFEMFQLAKLQLFFGWVHKDTGMRRFREVIDIRGRKCGKSTETAAVELDMLLDDEELGAEIYCTANKKDQANLIFNEAVNMRAQSPEIRKVTRKRQSDIYFPATMSYIMSLAADTSTMDGLNAHFFSLDEWHEAKTSAVYDVMQQSQSAREQPVAWLISTAGFVRNGFYDEKFDAAHRIALWEEGAHDYLTLVLIYKLDRREEWMDESCWEKANPGLGKIKRLDSLRANVERAKREPGYLATLLTKDFNIPENSASNWLSYEQIVNEQVADMQYLKESYAIGGCDLSATTDLTCATLMIRKPDDPVVYVLQQYFLPRSRVDAVDRESRREAPYKRWAELGWLTICDGATVDYHEVTKWFVKMVTDYDIRPLWICYDAALSGYWVPEMVEYGFDMEKIRQGPFTWTYPMKDLGGALEEKRVVYQNNPILRWCLSNVAKKSTNKDGVESIQPVKCSSVRRIDGMVSLLNAWVGYLKHYDEYIPYLR